jgi:hypothetical protein
MPATKHLRQSMRMHASPINTHTSMIVNWHVITHACSKDGMHASNTKPRGWVDMDLPSHVDIHVTQTLANQL